MEEYDDLENYAPNALSATATATATPTKESKEKEVLHLSMDNGHQLEDEWERNTLKIKPQAETLPNGGRQGKIHVRPPGQPRSSHQANCHPRASSRKVANAKMAAGCHGRSCARVASHENGTGPGNRGAKTKLSGEIRQS